MTSTVPPSMTRAVSERSILSSVRLIPPYAEEFGINGVPETDDAAREWAVDRHYRLVRGVNGCPHGLYGMDLCPGDCNRMGDLDHVNIWYGHDSNSLFLLSHPYTNSVATETQVFAAAHGLRVSCEPPDDWYAPNYALPIRLTADTGSVVWPLVPRLLTLATLLPFAWEL